MERLYPLFVRDIKALIDRFYGSSRPVPLYIRTREASNLSLIRSLASDLAALLTDRYHLSSREITAARSSGVANTSRSMLGGQSASKDDGSPELLTLSKIRLCSSRSASPPNAGAHNTNTISGCTLAENRASNPYDLREVLNSIPSVTESGSEFSEDSGSSSVSSSIKFSVPCTSLAAGKAVLIDAVMDQFMTFFANCYRSPHVYLAANVDILDGTQNHGSKDGFKQSNNNPQSSNHAGKGKRRAENDDNNEDGEQEQNDDPSSKRHRGASPGAEELGKYFACPYFKRDRRKYQRFRSCPGPGWSTVHRMK
jgi:hypothetical protein